MIGSIKKQGCDFAPPPILIILLSAPPSPCYAHAQKQQGNQYSLIHFRLFHFSDVQPRRLRWITNG